MAIDSFMCFKPYGADPIPAESQVDLSKNTGDTLYPSLFKTGNPGNVFEIDDYSFDIEQQLNIGSQSSGAGAGKVTFNPFSITRKVDIASADFFQKACSGTAFETVILALRKSGGGDTSGKFFLRFDFKLVAVKTIEWAHDDEAPKETVTFEYGALFIQYGQQLANGQIDKPKHAGWNRVRNVVLPTADTAL